MLRRYSVGQSTPHVSTTPPTEAPLAAGTSPPSSPVRARLRRSSEGQSSTPSVSIGVRLAPLRAAAATVFGSNRNTLPSDSSHTPPTGSVSPTPSQPLNESRSGSSTGFSVTSGPVHRVRLVPFLDMTRSLLFVPTELELRENGHAVQIGRFSERRRADTQGEADTTAPADAPTPAVEVTTDSVPAAVAEDQAVSAARASAATVNRQQTRVTFKSKVVSRLHAEMWCDTGGKVYIRDTRSSSGTFLNHVRLSPPGVLSRAFPLKDGDVLQFGIDYQGGMQELYRCIKLRIELDHDTRLQPTAYGTNMLRQLQSMQPDARASSSMTRRDSQTSNEAPVAVPATATIADAPPPVAATASSQAPAARRPAGPELAECCICLFKIKVCQALFIAPCSHIFHYKCIRPILTLHHPGFSCPLCRMFVNLDEDVEVDDDEDDEDDRLPMAAMRDPHTGHVLSSQSNQPPAQAEEVAESAQERVHAPISPTHVSDAPPTSRPLDAIVELDSPALGPTQDAPEEGYSTPNFDEPRS